ncbi:MAG: helix-turn-helix transcriptional regulator [Anaerolineaceae bacterium]|jgi:transcriptional regulator with XRE-family HTH domain|nr:helix-turn-helix transcriptional regulator [Anaerolineaceae bacterium]
MMKNNKLYIQIRSKKLGILLLDARLSTGSSTEEISEKTGIPEERLLNFENGSLSPSLPELEILAFTYNLPVEHFWGKQILKSEASEELEEKFQTLLKIRNKIIGANIKSKRQINEITSEELAEKCDLEHDQLSQFENGETQIPIPVLEIIARCLNCQIEDFFDTQGKIGAWRKENAEINRLKDLPQEFREFITKPINAPYLDLAMKLSELDVKKLRLVAEGLLEITL